MYEVWGVHNFFSRTKTESNRISRALYKILRNYGTVEYEVRKPFVIWSIPPAAEKDN